MKRLLFIVTLLLSTACASSYTNTNRSPWGGFEEQQVSERVWVVGYNGNGYTSHYTVQSYWFYRAAELTLELGYVGFRFVNNVDLERAINDGYVGKPSMYEKIELIKAPLGDDVSKRAYDAKALLAFLEPHVKGKKCGTNVCPHVRKYLYPDFQ